MLLCLFFLSASVFALNGILTGKRLDEFEKNAVIKVVDSLGMGMHYSGASKKPLALGKHAEIWTGWDTSLAQYLHPEDPRRKMVERLNNSFSNGKEVSYSDAEDLLEQIKESNDYSKPKEYDKVLVDNHVLSYTIGDTITNYCRMLLHSEKFGIFDKPENGIESCFSKKKFLNEKGEVGMTPMHGKLIAAVKDFSGKHPITKPVCRDLVSSLKNAIDSIRNGALIPKTIDDLTGKQAPAEVQKTKGGKADEPKSRVWQLAPYIGISFLLFTLVASAALLAKAAK